MLEGIGRFDHASHGFCMVPVCQGVLQNKEFYAFVAVEPQNYPYFKKHYRRGQSSNFDVYGQELLRGWGPAPPEDILEFMRRKYKIEFSVEPLFIERMLAVSSVSPAQLSKNVSPFPLKPATAPGS